MAPVLQRSGPSLPDLREGLHQDSWLNSWSFPEISRFIKSILLLAPVRNQQVDAAAEVVPLEGNPRGTRPILFGYFLKRLSRVPG